MKRIQRKLVLSQEDYYIKHLEIINLFFPNKMKPMEIKFLAAFMALPKALIEEEMFNTIARKKVMEKLGLSPGGVSNYIGSLIDKEHLVQSEITKRITPKDYLFPIDDGQGYEFMIVKE